ncbi:hypothetical protein CVT26_004456 [Gymnopilus dilepis]|uniref:F-box domain-containing protein n=1 Tax=Gymnopilus dilepis TaxID=231916 RepID=A0A409W6X6_9AGAR|nr:hypothetical protein CVT26_004456 [Gymnopilus dilepis]
MSVPTQPSLPQDIVDLIIDNLFHLGGKKALVSIALSSSSSLYRTRLHLFSSLYLISKCNKQTAEDLDTFRDFLKHSPEIGPLVRCIYVGTLGCLYKTRRNPGKSWPCPFHGSPDRRHTLNEDILYGFSERKWHYLLSILPSLINLRELRYNYGTPAKEDWSADSRPLKLVNALLSPPSIAVISLFSLRQVPPSFFETLLRLSSLQFLVIEDVELDLEAASDVGGSLPRRSELGELTHFGLVIRKDPLGFFRALGKLIIANALQTLRSLTWYINEPGQNLFLGDIASSNIKSAVDFNIQRLTNLKTFSTYCFQGPLGYSLKTVLLRIIAASEPRLEVLELFDVDVFYSGRTIEYNKDSWDQLDEWLQEEPLSGVREIRFLFYSLLPGLRDVNHTRGTTEEVVGIISKFLPLARARGVCFTYGIRYGADRMPSLAP